MIKRLFFIFLVCLISSLVLDLLNTENIIAPVYGGMLLGLVVSYFMVNRKRVGLYR